MQSMQVESETKKPDVTLIHVIDIENQECWALSKCSLLGANNAKSPMAQILIRRKDFQIQCGCKTTNRALLYARKRKGRDELCNQPSENWGHDPACPYWTVQLPALPTEPLTRVDRASSLRCFFTPQDIGTLPDTEDKSNGEMPPGPRRSGRKGRVRPSSLASAILMLLDFGDLNYYVPATSTTSWTENAKALASAIQVLSRGQPTTVRLPRVVADWMHIRLDELPMTESDHVAPVTPRLVLGSVVGCRQQGRMIYVRIEGFDHEIRVAPATWRYSIKRSASRHTRNALIDLGKLPRAARVIALFELTRDEWSDVTAHRVGLCTTSAELVPVESSYELQITNYLVAQGRTFIKDIYVPEGYRFRHDIRLLDVGLDFLIEVHGMDTPKYNEGKRPVEEDLARNCAGRYLIWLAVHGYPLPALPPKQV